MQTQKRFHTPRSACSRVKACTVHVGPSQVCLQVQSIVCTPSDSVIYWASTLKLCILENNSILITSGVQWELIDTQSVVYLCKFSLKSFWNAFSQKIQGRYTYTSKLSASMGYWRDCWSLLKIQSMYM